MADYTVTITNRLPAAAILEYSLSAEPVVVSLSDLPAEPMELDSVMVTATVTNPSAVSYIQLGILATLRDHIIARGDGLSPIAATQYFQLIPSVTPVTSGQYIQIPMARVLLCRLMSLRLSLGGTLDTDFTNLKMSLLCRYSSPRRVDDLITRTMYRDADGYITP